VYREVDVQAAGGAHPLQSAAETLSR